MPEGQKFGADNIADDSLGAGQLAPNSVGTSELSAGILPWNTGPIPCVKPAVIEKLGEALVEEAVTITGVRVLCGTLPTGATDAFSFNIKNGTSDIFASNQVFAREPDVTGFQKTTDNGAAYTSYLTEVTGAGQAILSSLDTVANGDWVVVGYSQPFAGVRIDVTANVNTTVTTLAAHYWDGAAWQAVGNLVDGTAAGGAPFAQDGAITWDTPAGGAWQASTINSINRYWIRLSTAAAFSAAVEVDNADAIRDTATAYAFTPDQNLTVTAGTLLSINCTEADANADKLVVDIIGNVTT